MVRCLVWWLVCFTGYLFTTPGVAASEEFECFQADEQLVRLQLYVGSEPGASWELDCEGQGLVWNQSSDEASTWVFEHFCTIPSDSCQFSIQASGDTFYALVMGATTLAVSSKEVEDVDQSICFGVNCEQLPLELSVMDDDDTTASASDQRTGRNSNSSNKAQPSSGVSSTLLRQKTFILWLVATGVTLVTFLLVYHCCVKARRAKAQARKDDETLQEDAAFE